MKKGMEKEYIKKISIGLVIAYCILTIAFYFLAGEQLILRNSRSNIAMATPESGTIEMIEGAVAEQHFCTEIQRIKSVSIMVGTFYRTNQSQLQMELIDSRNQAVLMSQTFDTAIMNDGECLTITSETPLEGYYQVPLILRITANGQPGNAITPIMNNTVASDTTLLINGDVWPGTLCFAVNGEDYIWTGIHYWQFVVLFGLLLSGYLAFTWQQWKKGRRSLWIDAVFALQKYKFLIKQLVNRDFKGKYKRSVLGVFWSFLNPLLNMLVLYIVFSNLFRFDIPHYPVYLISGITMFNFFSESCGMSLTSIVGNSQLIKKVYMPKYIYPLTRTISSLVNLVISMIPLLIVTIVNGVYPTKAWLLAPYALICIAIFSLGLGMLLASAMVFFCDVQFLWGVVSTIWMYMTPIFYPAAILPENIAWVLKLNPLYYFISFLRVCIMDGISPEPFVYFQNMLVAVGMLLLGSWVFKKTQNNFVLYL